MFYIRVRRFCVHLCCVCVLVLWIGNTLISYCVQFFLFFCSLSFSLSLSLFFFHTTLLFHAFDSTKAVAVNGNSIRLMREHRCWQINNNRNRIRERSVGRERRERMPSSQRLYIFGAQSSTMVIYLEHDQSFFFRVCVSRQSSVTDHR